MIGLVIHNKEHHRLVQALAMVGALGGQNAYLIAPFQLIAGKAFDAIVVADAPEYADRANPAYAASYRQWIDEVLAVRLLPGAKITYLHPAGEPM